MNPQPPEICGEIGAVINGAHYFHGVRCFYRPGETIYIKEAWARGPVLGAGSEKWAGREILYRATDVEISAQWKSPRFMPEWASRSRARIVSVMPERVQEITLADVVKEGINPVVESGQPDCHDGTVGEIIIKRFSDLWESLHPGSWERNDWVFRYELEKLP